VNIAAIKSKHQWTNIAVLSLLIYLVVFLKIDTYHIRWWDESLFAVNTYEMLKNGDYFSLYFDGHPDLVNSKPPFAVWMQLLFVKAIGYNEIAVRLPSVIAAAISIFLVFFFIQKRFGNYFAWLSALVLLTSQGYIGFHTARTADADSLLTMFVLVANIYFLKFLEKEKQSHVLLFFLFITLAFLTKMYSALLFIPGYIFILIKEKKFRPFFFRSAFWIGLGTFIVIIAAVFYIREVGSPGYLREIFFKDAGRIFNVIEGHDATWEYYLDNFIFTRYSFWFIPLLIGLMFVIFNYNNPAERLFYNIFVLVVSYLLIVSVSVTKLLWYDMPVYPYLSMLTAYSLYKIFEKQINLNGFNRMSMILLVVIFSYPYWIMFRKSQANTIPNGEKKNEASERFLFLRSNSRSNLNDTKLYHYGWDGSLLFYKYKFAEKGEKLELTIAPEFRKNDKVLLSQDSLFDIVSSKYKFKILEKENNARLLLIEETL
jgi:4-amino-4-deoxy-L-arabinose transferase-like glycosyltransferase